MTTQPPGPRPLRRLSQWSALGVLAAGLLLAEVNVHSARSFHRWDVSRKQVFSLSDPSRQLLASLDRDVTFTLLLSTDNPFRAELRYLLESYRAASRYISIVSLDPDREPVRYLAHLRNAGLLAEGAQGSDPVLIAESGERKWVIHQHQLSRTNDAGEVESLIEQNLSEAVAQLRSDRRDVVCFVTGHGEASLDDVSPGGLTQLGEVLRRAHIEVKRAPLDVPDAEGELTPCTALAVVGPERPWPLDHVELLSRTIDRGVHLLAWIDPLVDHQGRVQDPGLAGLFERWGVYVEPAFILEHDSSKRLPSGLGESFFATVQTHPITQGLSTAEVRTDARVFFSAAQPLWAAPGSPAQALLTSSRTARLITDLTRPDAPKLEQGPFTLSYASELRLAGSKATRSWIVGSSDWARNEALTDPAQFGSRVFLDHAISWLLERNPLVSVPPEQTMSAGLHLTEESLRGLLRYVLFYMPLCAALVGAWVLWRRRS